MLSGAPPRRRAPRPPARRRDAANGRAQGDGGGRRGRSGGARARPKGYAGHGRTPLPRRGAIPVDGWRRGQRTAGRPLVAAVNADEVHRGKEWKGRLAVRMGGPASRGCPWTRRRVHACVANARPPTYAWRQRRFGPESRHDGSDRCLVWGTPPRPASGVLVTAKSLGLYTRLRSPFLPISTDDWPSPRCWPSNSSTQKTALYQLSFARYSTYSHALVARLGQNRQSPTGSAVCDPKVYITCSQPQCVSLPVDAWLLVPFRDAKCRDGAVIPPPSEFVSRAPSGTCDSTHAQQ